MTYGQRVTFQLGYWRAVLTRLLLPCRSRILVSRWTPDSTQLGRNLLLRMRVLVSTMHSSLVTATHDKKRKREDLVPASDQHLLPALHTADSAPTSFALEDGRMKRQHVLVGYSIIPSGLPLRVQLYSDT